MQDTSISEMGLSRATRRKLEKIGIWTAGQLYDRRGIGFESLPLFNSRQSAEIVEALKRIESTRSSTADGDSGIAGYSEDKAAETGEAGENDIPELQQGTSDEDEKGKAAWYGIKAEEKETGNETAADGAPAADERKNAEVAKDVGSSEKEDPDDDLQKLIIMECSDLLPLLKKNADETGKGIFVNPDRGLSIRIKHVAGGLGLESEALVSACGYVLVATASRQKEILSADDKDVRRVLKSFANDEGGKVISVPTGAKIYKDSIKPKAKRLGITATEYIARLGYMRKSTKDFIKYADKARELTCELFGPEWTESLSSGPARKDPEKNGHDIVAGIIDNGYMPKSCRKKLECLYDQLAKAADRNGNVDLSACAEAKDSLYGLAWKNETQGQKLLGLMGFKAIDVSEQSRPSDMPEYKMLCEKYQNAFETVPGENGKMTFCAPSKVLSELEGDVESIGMTVPEFIYSLNKGKSGAPDSPADVRVKSAESKAENEIAEIMRQNEIRNGYVYLKPRNGETTVRINNLCDENGLTADDVAKSHGFKIIDTGGVEVYDWHVRLFKDIAGKTGLIYLSRGCPAYENLERFTGERGLTVDDYMRMFGCRLSSVGRGAGDAV